MERLKMFLGSVAIMAILVGGTLLFARVVADRELNDQLASYEHLRSGIRELCVTGTEEQFNTAAALITKANREIAEHQNLNRSGFVGDFIMPDAWDVVGFISIPTEMECARLKRAVRIRECELLIRADWQAEFDRGACGELLAAGTGQRP